MIAKPSELRADAQLVIEVISEKEDVQLDYTPESVSWLDAYIAQHRARLNASDKILLCEKFGAFLGETIRQHCGGQWVKPAGRSWLIALEGQEPAAPFELIDQHLDHPTALTQIFEHIPRAGKAAHN